MINLRGTYGKRYKIGMDESYEAETYEGKTKDEAWYQEMLGVNGKLYNNSSTHLQLLLKRRKGIQLERALPKGWVKHQDADDGMTFILPNGDIAEAFKWLKPRKRRIGNPNNPNLVANRFKPKAIGDS